VSAWLRRLRKPSGIRQRSSPSPRLAEAAEADLEIGILRI
jgi:hypothetical protein